MYQVYVLPNCEECHKALEAFKKRGLNYEEINTGSLDGRKKFQMFYKDNREKIKRDEIGMIILPLIVNNGNIYQGKEDLEKLLEK